MRSRALPAIGAVLAPAVAFVAALTGAMVTGSSAEAATSNGGYKIMPLGDSITLGLGSSGGGYRPSLWQKLVGAGATVDFVGSQADNPPRNGLGDGDHEGHSGWTTQQIYDNITNWQRSYQPQTILLHIGTNDITNNNWSNAANLLGQLVDRMLANNPSVNVFVAQIVPLSYTSGDNNAKSFNATIPNMVAQRASRGSKVYVVDLHSPLGGSDLSDAVHPNDTGYQKMATGWFSALQQHPEAYGKGTPTTTSTTTTTTTSVPPTTTTTTSVPPTTTTTTTTTTAPTSKTTSKKPGKLKTVKKCKTGKNGKKTCKTIIRTVKPKAAASSCTASIGSVSSWPGGSEATVEIAAAGSWTLSLPAGVRALSSGSAGSGEVTGHGPAAVVVLGGASLPATAPLACR